MTRTLRAATAALDDNGFTPCGSPIRVKAKKKGRHSFARATDEEGNTDSTPAARSWKKRRKAK